MKPSLLRRFRWPIFVVLFSGAHVAGIAYLYGDSQTAMYGLITALFACFVAVVLNSIDESPKSFEEKYNQNTEQ
jgi:hypothetical protein